jgi:tRNA G10  N-methylase Trm11
MKQASQSRPNGRTPDADRRKRLGQYFTGGGLGRILAALAQAEKADGIIDPMAGSGDLLASCLEIGAAPASIAGIEIDRAARDACSNRLPHADCILGSAFDPDTISRLPKTEWDLVIGNPPYVRYQSFSEKAEADHFLPNAIQIRTGLLQILPRLSALDREDKSLFAHIISGYSGLSDLAVPSWILCAGLVKLGGRLALVVPESWLTRDYATIVHYLLFRWFNIEFVVEDEHASWFDDAQVKTTLIVAKRVKRRASALVRADSSTYCHILISAAAAGPESPIGRIAIARGSSPERNFAKQARSWLRNGTSHRTGLTRARPVSMKLACRNMIAAASRQKWFSAIGETGSQASEGIYVSYEIHDWLAHQGIAPAFAAFESQGVAVGQGLRTGANDFFYAEGARASGHIALSFSGPLAGLTARAPDSIARPVIRRQSELPAGFTVSPDFATSWALDLRQHALPEDLDETDMFPSVYECMPESIAAVVRAAGQANFGTDTKPQKVWNLTAVSPNIRPASRGMPPRHWYMLPDFAARHLPDVLLARVNSSTPTAYLNKARRCLIDANFSTMWTLPLSKWSAAALLGFMNSAWAQAVIETSGAVMGGGALKVEAAHLRRFPVPAFTEDQLCELSKLGDELAAKTKRAEANAVLNRINAVVAKAFGCSRAGVEELKKIARAGQERRAKHNTKKGGHDGCKVC